MSTITFRKGSSSVSKEGNRKHKIAVPETSLTSQGRAQANWQYSLTERRVGPSRAEETEARGHTQGRIFRPRFREKWQGKQTVER